jgi:hypothetical protein
MVVEGRDCRAYVARSSSGSAHWPVRRQPSLRPDLREHHGRWSRLILSHFTHDSTLTRARWMSFHRGQDLPIPDVFTKGVPFQSDPFLQRPETRARRRPIR